MHTSSKKNLNDRFLFEVFYGHGLYGAWWAYQEETPAKTKSQGVIFIHLCHLGVAFHILSY